MLSTATMMMATVAAFLLLATQDMTAMATTPVRRATIVRGPPRGSVVQWLVQYMYRSNDCSGEAQRTESVALGACIGGVDPDGQPMDSWSTYLNSTDGISLTLTDVGFASADCSGPTTHAFKRVEPLGKCDYGSLYQLVNSTNPAPWAGANKGVVVLDSVHGDCSSPSEVFQAISFDFCMGVSDPGNGAATMRYESCTADKVVYSYYSDWGCAQLIETKEFPTSLCMECPGSEHCYPQGFWYRTQETFLCNA